MPQLDPITEEIIRTIDATADMPQAAAEPVGLPWSTSLERAPYEHEGRVTSLGAGASERASLEAAVPEHIKLAQWIDENADRPEKAPTGIVPALAGAAERVMGTLGRAISKTTPALVAELIAGEPIEPFYSPPPEKPFPGEALLEEIVTFAADPATIIPGGLGAKVGKRLFAKQLLKRGAPKTVARAVGRKAGAGAVASGVGLGGREFVRDPFEQMLETGEYAVGKHIAETAKATGIGAGMGITGAALPGRLLPLLGETAFLGTAGAVSEWRLPKLEDYEHSLGVVLGLRVARKLAKVPGALYKRSRGKPLTPAEIESVKELTPEQQQRLETVAEATRARRAEIEGEQPTTRPTARVEDAMDVAREAAEAVRPPGEEVGVISLDNALSRVQRGTKAVRAIGQRFFTSRGQLPPPAFDLKVQRDGRVGALMTEIAWTTADFKRAAKKAYGSRKISPHDQVIVNAALGGRISLDALPEPIRPFVKRMRAQQDQLSTRLIALGVVEGEVAVTVDQNRGVYLHRSYRAFDDPKWADKVDPAVRNKMKAMVRQEFPDYTENQIDNELGSVLYEAKESQSPIALLSRSKLGSKDLSILRRRKDLPVEFREFLGEYKDPIVNYTKSVGKTGTLIANHQFLTEVRKAGMGKFFFEPDDPAIPREAIAKIAADQSEVMYPLNGLKTTPEVKTAFQRALEPQLSGSFFRYYMKANLGVKMAKTVLSPVTHERNFLANPFISLRNGHWDIREVPGAFKTTLAGLGVMRGDAWRSRFLRLRELGIVSESARANELQAVIRDASKGELTDFTDSYAVRGAKKAGRAAIKLYTAEDDVWKVFGFENELARYRKALPELSQAEVEQIVAKNIRDTYPTWSMVPEFFQHLRRFPAMGTFVSFPAEIWRTSYNNLRIAERELRDPRLRHIGIRRVAGTLAAATATASVAAAGRFLTGTTRQEDEDVREFIAPWSENSELLHIGGNESGTKRRIIDLSYTDPHEYLKKPVIAFMRGEDWDAAFVDAIKEAGRPFYGEEILFGKIADVVRNKKPTGGPVYDDSADAGPQAEAILSHLYEAFKPGIQTTGERIGRAATGQVGHYGQTYDLATEIPAATFGQRPLSVDVLQSLSFKAGDFKKSMAKTSGAFSSLMYRRGPVDEQDLRTAHAAMEQGRRRLFDEMVVTIHKAMRLGAVQREVALVLRSAGVGRTMTAGLLMDRYRPYALSKQFGGRAGLRLEALPVEGSTTGEEYGERGALARELQQDAFRKLQQKPVTP